MDKYMDRPTNQRNSSEEGEAAKIQSHTQEMEMSLSAQESVVKKG